MGSPERGTWGGFIVWALVGALVFFCLLDFIPIGALLLLIGVIAAVKKPSLRKSAAGSMTGVGALLLYVAWVQRQGPGTVCWHTANASGCGDYLDPLPWLIAGAVFVIAGIAIQVRQRRSQMSSGSSPSR